jgi:hypothetical protein
MIDNNIKEILKLGLSEQEIDSGTGSAELVDRFLQQFPDHNGLKEFLSNDEQMALLVAIGRDNTILLKHNLFNDLPIMKKSQIIFKVPSNLMPKLAIANYFK